MIAQACGVNQSTVSHALRNNAKIPVATRERIRAVAEGMGWKPNPLAAAFMAHLRNSRLPAHQASIGFLLSSRKSGLISDQPMHLQRHHHGARQRAEELGYTLENIWLHQPHLTARRLKQVLSSRNISGVIVSGQTDADGVLADFDWSSFAAIALGYSLPKPPLHRVAVHTLRGFDSVLEKVQSLGYRRLAIVVSLAYDRLVNHGFLYPSYYAQKHTPRPTTIDIYTFPVVTPKELPRIQAWLQKKRPDVVLGEGFALKAIQEMGWRVPQDVAFANVDAAPEYPQIGGFNQRHELHGSIAMDILVEQLLHNERGIPSVPRSILVEGTWREGMSIPPKADIAGMVGSIKKSSR